MEGVSYQTSDAATDGVAFITVNTPKTFKNGAGQLPHTSMWKMVIEHVNRRFEHPV